MAFPLNQHGHAKAAFPSAGTLFAMEGLIAAVGPRIGGGSVVCGEHDDEDGEMKDTIYNVVASGDRLQAGGSSRTSRMPSPSPSRNSAAAAS
jgi:hypothetical protein